ncbi:flagellar hook-length control protein FliK [Methylobacterium sp. Leaf118]|uniref:flagellar hook-length control protein FliK n=1 Tax=Methylobacterium sp. Leaf118 TaxID=2876562 RepID=UPI001E40C159|nr:flagellar hook-length control protein FliK [Methylobacterium sp. Leaf118]
MEAPAEPRRADGTVIEALAPTIPGAPTLAGPLSPARQIADAVAAQFPPAPPPAALRSGLTTEAGPLKILTLQLHPADLGSVLVRMRLQDGRLEMSLRTAREDTAERLRREGEALTGLLREAGYLPERVTIESGPAAQGGAQGQSQGQSPGNGSERGGHPPFAADAQDRNPGGATPDQSGRRPTREGARDARAEEQDHDTASHARDRGGLYL